MDVSAKQVVSAGRACMGLLEKDECKGGLMGGKMEGEGVGLMKGEGGFVGSGMEHVGGGE